MLFLGLGIFSGVFRLTSGAIFGVVGEVVSKKMRIAVFRVSILKD
jgi:hypothetical protein